MLEFRNPDLPRNNSPQVCGNLCYEKGFKYVGLQYIRNCFCGNTMRNYGKKPETDCNHRCPGNSSHACGGLFRQNIWEWKEVGKGTNKDCFLSSSFSFSFVLVVDLFLTSFLVIGTCWPQTNLTLEFQRLLTTYFETLKIIEKLKT